MYATLNFGFPTIQNPKEQRIVSVCVFVPAPEKRPKMASNFFFMCTGVLPSSDLLCFLGISTTTPLFSQLPQLRSFFESAVVRIEKDVMIEIGSSTTKTIFGSCINDEPPLEAKSSCPTLFSFLPQQTADSVNNNKTLNTKMSELCAGTVLVGNLGMPDTNGSRYYILLNDIVTEKQRAEFGVYHPLGVVTAGLDALQEACRTARVRQRTFAPLQSVTITTSDVYFDRGFLGHGDRASVQENENGVTKEGRRGGSAATQLNRCKKGRDEMEENEGAFNEIAKTGETAAELSGVLRGPCSSAIAPFNYSEAVGGPVAKRARMEVFAAPNHAPATPHTTTSTKDAGDTFNYFAAQEAVFISDIELIKDAQVTRKRNYKKHQLVRMHNTSAKKGLGGLPKSTDNTAATRKKTLIRRY